MIRNCEFQIFDHKFIFSDIENSCTQAFMKIDPLKTPSRFGPTLVILAYALKKLILTIFVLRTQWQFTSAGFMQRNWHPVACDNSTA